MTGTSGGTTGTTGSSGTSSRPEEMGGREGRRMGAEMGEKVGEKVGGMTGSIGQRLERAGSYVEERRGGGMLSDKLHSAGRYLQEHDTRTIARSIDSAICAHPYRGILIGLGVGWVVGRLFGGRD